MNCDVGKARKGWRMSCDVGKARKGWRMCCDVGEETESLENELCYDYSDELWSFSNLSVTSIASQLILQHFCRFTYATTHSPNLPLLHLRHSSFSNSSFASPTSQALHLIHLASRPCLRAGVFNPRPSGEFCAAREGYFTKYNAL